MAVKRSFEFLGLRNLAIKMILSCLSKNFGICYVGILRVLAPQYCEFDHRTPPRLWSRVDEYDDNLYHSY